MSMTSNKTLTKEGQIILESLQNAVTQTLENKKRLGRYAVVWRDGKPVVTGGDVTQNRTDNFA